jgi:hypothetical protein
MIEIGAEKSRFIAKSAMTFAQFIGTAGLATRLFGDFSTAWKITLVLAMLILVMLALIAYPNRNGGE